MTYSKMDTQGMSMPVDPNDPKYKKTFNKEPHKPWLCTPTRVLTETMVKELKILINEVLDEREHKKRLEGAYDDVKTLPPSYLTQNTLGIMLGRKNHPIRIGVNENPT